MTAEKTPPAEKTSKVPRKPRKARTCYLLCGASEKWTVVAQGKTLTDIRSYTPTDEQDGCHFIEVVQIGSPFVLRREQTTIRSAVK